MTHTVRINKASPHLPPRQLGAKKHTRIPIFGPLHVNISPVKADCVADWSTQPKQNYPWVNFNPINIPFMLVCHIKAFNKYFAQQPFG